MSPNRDTPVANVQEYGAPATWPRSGRLPAPPAIARAMKIAMLIRGTGSERQNVVAVQPRVTPL